MERTRNNIIVVCAKSSVCISSGSFGSIGLAVDAKDDKLLLFALSLGSVYLVACFARR